MIPADLAIWASLRQLTARVQEVADDITVVFVANRQHGLSSDSEDRSTEYFTDYETNQILTGLRLNGFRTLYFEGENEFIAFVLERAGRISNSKWSLVYNTAQSGTDPGRKSMVPAFCALHGLWRYARVKGTVGLPVLIPPCGRSSAPRKLVRSSTTRLQIRATL